MAFAYNNLGSVSRELKKYDEAIEAYSKAVEINAEYFIAFNNRGLAKYEKALQLQEQNKIDDAKVIFAGAIEDFQMTVNYKNTYAIAYNNMGMAMLKMDDYAGAGKAFTKAIEINEKYAQAYANRGTVREMQRDFKGACNDWKKAVEYGIEDPSTYLKGCK